MLIKSFSIQFTKTKDGMESSVDEILANYERGFRGVVEIGDIYVACKLHPTILKSYCDIPLLNA